MLRAQQLVRGTTEFDAAVAVWDWGFKLGGLEADQLFEGCDASPAELQLPDDVSGRPGCGAGVERLFCRWRRAALLAVGGGGRLRVAV